MVFFMCANVDAWVRSAPCSRPWHCLSAPLAPSALSISIFFVPMTGFEWAYVGDDGGDGAVSLVSVVVKYSSFVECSGTTPISAVPLGVRVLFYRVNEIHDPIEVIKGQGPSFLVPSLLCCFPSLPCLPLLIECIWLSCKIA